MPKIINNTHWTYNPMTGLYGRLTTIKDVDMGSIAHRLYAIFQQALPDNIIITEGKRIRHKQSPFSKHITNQSKNLHSKLANEIGIVRLTEYQIKNSEGKSWYSDQLYNDIYGNQGIIRISDHPLSEKTWCVQTDIDHGIDIVIPQMPNQEFKELNNLHGVRNTMKVYQFVFPDGPNMSKDTFRQISTLVSNLLKIGELFIPKETIAGIHGEIIPKRPINESLTNDILLHVTDGNYSDTNYYKTKWPEGYGCSMHKGKLTDVFYFDIRPINMTSKCEVYASSFLASQMDFNKGLPTFRLKTNAPMIWFEIPELRIFLNPSLKASCYGKNTGDFSVLGYGGESYNDFLTEYVTDLFEYTSFFVLKKRGHRFNLV